MGCATSVPTIITASMVHLDPALEVVADDKCIDDAVLINEMEDLDVMQFWFASCDRHIAADDVSATPKSLKLGSVAATKTALSVVSWIDETVNYYAKPSALELSFSMSFAEA
jgi:hypothetical protein